MQFSIRVANQLVDVKESIPEHFETAENDGEFWDTYDLADYLDETREIKRRKPNSWKYQDTY